MIRGIVALGFASLILAGMPVAPAFADVVVATADVAATSDDGTVTAEFSVTNTADIDVELTPTVAPVECKVGRLPVLVGARSTSSVKLTLDDCFTEARTTVMVDLDGEGPAGPVKVTAPDEPSDWTPLWLGMLVAVLLSVPVGLWGVTEKEDAVRDGTKSVKGKTARFDSYEAVREIVDARMKELAPRQGLDWMELTDPGFPSYTLGSPIRNLEAGWSFKDSWVANLTIASGALVALLTSTDVLTAWLGAKPTAALGVMTTAGLVSAVIIGIANTVLKLVGPKVSDVTVGGLSLSTSLVVLAAAFQVSTLGLVVARSADGWALSVGAVLLAVVVAAVLEVYAFRSLGQAVRKGFARTLPEVPADATSAWAAEDEWEKDVVAAQIRGAFAEWLKIDESRPTGPSSRGIAPEAPVARPPRPEARRRPLL